MSVSLKTFFVFFLCFTYSDTHCKYYTHDSVCIWQPEEKIFLRGRFSLPRKASHLKTKIPAIVFLHGTGGMFHNTNKPDSSLLREEFQFWRDHVNRIGYAALFVDSFSIRRNGKADTDVNDNRVLDAYAGFRWLTKNSTFSKYIDFNNVMLFGFSHGASTTLSTMTTQLPKSSASDAKTVATENFRFRCAIAYYPGCGLNQAFEYKSKSIYKNYSPIRIYHGGLDELCCEVCEWRIHNNHKNEEWLKMDVFPNAQHGFDRSEIRRPQETEFTRTDVNAAHHARKYSMKFLDQCKNNKLPGKGYVKTKKKTKIKLPHPHKSTKVGSTKPKVKKKKSILTEKKKKKKKKKQKKKKKKKNK